MDGQYTAHAGLVASILSFKRNAHDPASNRLARNVTQTMQMEAQLFQALAKSSEKLTLCLTDNPHHCNAAELTEHYHEMVKTLTDANMERLTNVSQLSHEFRRCLWEEI